MKEDIQTKRYHTAKADLANSRDIRTSHGRLLAITMTGIRVTSIGVRQVRRVSAYFPVALWTALANQKQAYTFQQFGGFVHSLAEEDVGLCFAFINLDASRDQHCRSLRRIAFHFLNQPRTIHARHNQVGEHQVDAAAAKGLERHLTAV